MPFTDKDGGPPHLQLEQTKPNSFTVLQDFRYANPKTDDRYLVEKGQDTDLASVPNFLSWFIPSYGTYTLAAVLHDYLWRKRHEIKLEDANRTFRVALYELQVPAVRRLVMWAGVGLAALWRRKGLWAARVIAWIVAVLGLDLVTVWVLVKGGSPAKLLLAAGLLAASLVLLLPHYPLVGVGVPALYALIPPILLITGAVLLYQAVEWIVYAVGQLWLKAPVTRRPGALPLNRPVMSSERLQRQDTGLRPGGESQS
jgi:hypothetical protein